MPAARTDLPLVLVTGASGYVGSRLVPALLAEGHRVRVLVRDRVRLPQRSWAAEVDVVEGDATVRADVDRALRGVAVAYYLLHSMDGTPRFAEAEHTMATTFADAAERADVGRVVYLGGIVPDDDEVSTHLASRRDVGQVFLDSRVPATVLRAAVVLGAGSASFEMLRHLTDRLLVLPGPAGVRSRVQPIAERDLLHYLLGSATMPAEVDRAFDVGGPDVLTYAEMMQRYAAVKGLSHRPVVTVPGVPNLLARHGIGLLTPVGPDLAGPLVASLVHDAVCHEHEIARWVPDPDGGLLGYEDAVRLALATAPGPGQDGRVHVEEHVRSVAASAEDTWAAVQRTAAEPGSRLLGALWGARGLLDRLTGGPGRRPDRPVRPEVGDAVDLWRVEEVREGRLLRLRAEARLPGTAWLELVVEPGPDGRAPTRLRQRTIFEPAGALGEAYWWAVLPAHGPVFGTMVDHVVRTAEGR